MNNSVALLFQRLTQGVYVVGVAHDEIQNAFTAAWIMQVSFEPLLLAVSVNPNHSSYRILQRGHGFSVNVLQKGQRELAGHFGRSAEVNKLAGVEWSKGLTGAPLLTRALAWFECKVEHECPAGDHVLVVGRVIGGKLMDTDAEPMLYRDTGDMDGASTLYPISIAHF